VDPYFVPLGHNPDADEIAFAPINPDLFRPELLPDEEESEFTIDEEPVLIEDEAFPVDAFDDTKITDEGGSLLSFDVSGLASVSDALIFDIMGLTDETIQSLFIIDQIEGWTMLITELLSIKWSLIDQDEDYFNPGYVLGHAVTTFGFQIYYILAHTLP
jgi:hypothetical protein